MSILKEIKSTRDDYQSFVDHLKTTNYVDNEISLATGWIEALNYVLYMMTDAKSSNSLEITEETLKQQEMIHCKDGHCDT